MVGVGPSLAVQRITAIFIVRLPSGVICLCNQQSAR